MRRAVRHPLVWGSISIGLLLLVAWRSKAWEIGDQLGTADGRPILLALAVNVVIMVAWAARSAALLRSAGRPVPIGPLVPMTAFANTINNLTPGSVGELARLYLLRAHHGVDYTTGGAVVIVERVVAIAYLAASAAILWVSWWLDLAWPVTVVALVVVAAIPSLIYGAGGRPSILVRGLPLGRLLGRERWEAGGAALTRVDESVATLLRGPRRTAAFAAWTAVVFAAHTAQLLLVAAAFGISLDPAVAWGALGLGIVAGVLSLLPFGLGSADLVTASLLGIAGVPATEAVTIVFGYRIVSTLPLGLAGVASYAHLSASLPDGDADEAARSVAEAIGDDRAGDHP